MPAASCLESMSGASLPTCGMMVNHLSNLLLEGVLKDPKLELGRPKMDHPECAISIYTVVPQEHQSQANLRTILYVAFRTLCSSRNWNPGDLPLLLWYLPCSIQAKRCEKMKQSNLETFPPTSKILKEMNAFWTILSWNNLTNSFLKFLAEYPPFLPLSFGMSRKQIMFDHSATHHWNLNPRWLGIWFILMDGSIWLDTR